MQRHFIFGCGFLGYRLARKLVQLGHIVDTVTRDATKAERLRKEGIEARVSEQSQWIELATRTDHPPLDSITIAIGNDGVGGTQHGDVYGAACEAALRLVDRQGVGRQPTLLFVSTTGVYAARRSGERTESTADPDVSELHAETTPVEITHSWVDESAEVGPIRPGSIASLQCERRLLGAAPEFTKVFRMAGIYSLDRIPNLNRLRAGQPLPGRGQDPLNLIHVEDAASILAAAMQSPPAEAVLNVADGCPVTRARFYTFLAERFQTASPVFTEEGGRQATGKRIDTARLQAWYPGPWRFPNYRLGLSEDVNSTR